MLVSFKRQESLNNIGQSCASIYVMNCTGLSPLVSIVGMLECGGDLNSTIGRNTHADNGHGTRISLLKIFCTYGNEVGRFHKASSIPGAEL